MGLEEAFGEAIGWVFKWIIVPFILPFIIAGFISYSIGFDLTALLGFIFLPIWLFFLIKIGYFSL
ncbi:MAG: hypothetical protein N2V75_06195 [Methanophagales archaeon]|nr:hypothetical protein [Methanophagales archaeon]